MFQTEAMGTVHIDDGMRGDQNSIVACIPTSDVEKTPSPQPYSHSNEPAKKDDVKIMSTVVPVLSYATAPATYTPMEEGVQMYAGAQPQPAAFPTTYQQGVSINKFK